MAISRRKFIKITAITSAGVLPLTSYLGYHFYEEMIADERFNDLLEFHVTDNNLLNVHLYFLNAKRKCGHLVPITRDHKSFMIVRMPQLHISEKGFWEDDWNNDNRKYPDAKMSGYSFFAFELWPDVITYDKDDPGKELSRKPVKKPSISFSLDRLLNWNDSANLDLITLIEWFDLKQSKNKRFGFSDFAADAAACEAFASKKTITKKELEKLVLTTTIETGEKMEPASVVFKKYKSLVTHFFDNNLAGSDSNNEFVPASFMEVPQGLIISPIARDGNEGFAAGRNKVKKVFWTNRYINQQKPREGIRKFELWNNTLLFRNAVQKESSDGSKTFEITAPSFRAMGLLLEDTNDFNCVAGKIECERQKETNYLPSLLNKTELVYLTQYAKENAIHDFTQKDFDIREINGLFFTGLGVITHLKYYNLDKCPVDKGIDLIEYEHIITQGRDVFIRVAHLGYNSKTGQRYKHVIEGKRTIAYKDIPATGAFKDSKGNEFRLPVEPASFIELKQYCECIDQHIAYTDEADVKDWKNNFIDLTNVPADHILSPAQTNAPDFKRNMFKELTTLEKKRIPIRCLQGDAFLAPDVCDNQQLDWFWPVKESGTVINQSAKTIPYEEYLQCEYEAKDWENQPIKAQTAFMFLRAKYIIINNLDAANADYFKGDVYDDADINLVDRRKTFFNNQKIAFTPSLQPKAIPKSLSNALLAEKDGNKLLAVQNEIAAIEQENLNASKSKVNIIETEFAESYFNVKKIASFNNKQIVNTKCVVFPQILRAKVFIDHIRDLTQQKIPSVIEYHKDYIEHEFKDITETKVYANAAKIILANTDKFIAGKEEKLNNTITLIGNALQQAKDKLGNLTVPDIIPDTISLEKFGVTLPKDIRKSIETGKTIIDTAGDTLNRISNFNPRELLRGKLSDVCGLDLTSILDELIPAGSSDNQTPLFEINKIANHVSDAITSSEVFQTLNTEVANAKAGIAALEKDYKDLKYQIDEKRLAYNARVAELTKIIPNADDLRNALKIEFENQRTIAFKLVLKNKYFNDVKDIVDSKAAEIKTYISDEITLLKELGCQKYKELKELDVTITDEISTIIKQVQGDPLLADMQVLVGSITSGNLINEVITEFKNSFVDLTLPALLSKLDMEVTVPMLATVDDTTALNNGAAVIYYNKASFILEPAGASPPAAQDQFFLLTGDAGYIQLQKKIEDIDLFISQNAAGTKFQTDAVVQLKAKLVEYNTKIAAVGGAIQRYSGVPNGKIYQYTKSINKWLTRYETILPGVTTRMSARTQNSLVNLVSIIKRINPYIDFLRKIDPWFYYTERQRIEKELTDIKRRIKQTDLSDYESAIDQVKSEYDKITAPAKDYVKAISNYIEDPANAQHAATLSELIKTRKLYNDVSTAALDVITDKTEFFLKNLISDAAVKKVYDTVKELRDEIDKKQNSYDNLIKAYSKKVNDQIVLLEGSLYEKLELFIEEHAEDINRINEARNLIRLLTSIKRQDLTYSWDTTKFRDINLGIVNFKKFSNPDTRLKIDVRATTEFSLGKFPPVIEKITTYSENRFTNFGVSFFNILTIGFNEISFIAGSDHSSHFEVKIKDVKFDGALSFVQKFESFLKTMGKGLILKLEGDHLALEYCLPIPSIKTPAFSFFNLSLNFDLRVYFDKRPIRFGFSLATAQSKFGIAATIYAGFGFFGIVADPKHGIVEIECALEAGVWTGISIGPIYGEVKLAFGFYYRKNEFGVRLEGYIVAEGHLSVWILEVSARVYLGIISENSVVEGECTVTLNVKLGFVSKSFSGSFHKTIAGAENKNNSEAKEGIMKHLKNELFTPHVHNMLGLDDDKFKKLSENFVSQIDRYLDTLADEEEDETYAVDDDQWLKFINAY